MSDGFKFEVFAPSPFGGELGRGVVRAKLRTLP